MCTGRIDPLFILEAFRAGADGVLVGGCHLGECHYQTGNYEAMVQVEAVRRLLDLVGLKIERLDLEWASAAEALLFVQLLTKFNEQIKELGPLGEPEGLDKETLNFRLNAACKVAKNARFRTALGNVARQIKKLGDYSPENISQKIEEKVVPVIKKILFEEEVKDLLSKGPISVDTLLKKTGATSDDIVNILETLQKKGKIERKGDTLEPRR